MRQSKHFFSLLLILCWSGMMVAQNAQSLVGSKRWAFVPESAQFGAGLRIEGLDSDENRFVFVDDQMLINIDYFGGRVVDNMTFHQAEEMYEEMNSPWGPSDMPPVFEATCRITNQDVTNNGGDLHIRVRYEVLSSNFNTMNSTNTIDIYIDAQEGTGSLRCNGFHYDETYYGSIAPVVMANDPK